MNELLLYNKNGAVLFSIDPEESSSHDWSLMSENKLSISFEREVCSVLTPGCYVEFDGIRYYLLDEYKPRMINSFTWKYDVTFLDAASWMSVVLAMNTLDGKNIPIFNYTGPAREHAAIIVANLNRHMGTTEWKVGSVIDTPNIAIEYRGKYCSQILQEIVDGQNTEWWVDGMTLNIGRAEFGDPVELGYRNGLLGDISREQAAGHRAYAYLVPIGSTRNIDPTKYGYDRLQLPDGQVFIDINPDGVGELIEERAFAEIFPRYEGTVQYVRSMPATGADGNEFTIYYIGDMLPFDPNDYEIAGLVKRITFQSGELMGESFEVNYNAEAQEFEIITQFPEGGIQLPGGFKTPATGDKYVIWNITMPDEYYTLASQEYLEAAEAFAESSVQDSSVYKGSLDYIDIQERGISVRPGRRVRLLSDEYFSKGYYDSRVTRMTRRLWYPDEISIDVSAVRVVGSIARLETSIQKAETQLSQLSGAQPAIIKSGEITPPSDKTVYSSAKCEEEFFNKRKGGSIPAPAIFEAIMTIVKGITGGDGSLFYYDRAHKCWVFKDDVLIEKGLATFSSIKDFTPSSVMNAIRCDEKTITVQDGVLVVIGGGGSGGGITTEQLEQALASYVKTDGKLPNPQSLKWAGASNGSYDGSAEATINIPAIPSSLPNPAGLYWYDENGVFNYYTGSEMTGLPSFASFAKKTDIPTIPSSLPNPNALSWSGHSTGSYDGSESKTITIPTELKNPKALKWSGNSSGSYDGSTEATITIPSTLPNPKALTWSGNSTGAYNGSADANIEIPTELPNPKALKWEAGKFSESSSSPYYGGTTKTLRVPSSVAHLDGGTLDGDLTVDGDLQVNGHIASLTSSDERLKKNIRTFSATEMLQSMGGVKQYEYTDDEVKRNPANAGAHIGFIYQNVAESQMADKMCCKRVDGYGALNYLSSDYQALLAAVILEQADRIKRLEEMLNNRTA